MDKNFEPKYIIPVKAKKVITELKKASAKADTTILATDQDREGESISWHLAQVLGLENNQIPSNKSQTNSKSKITNPKPLQRIVFHEITKEAIQEALAHPGIIDMNLVNAQQARRVLDRLVGYKLSPFLWKKVSKGLSAGRVQSVAVRLVVEKEEEIKKFVAVEYWTVQALLEQQIPNHNPPTGGKITNKTRAQTNENPRQFLATLTKKDGKAVDKLEIKNQALVRKNKKLEEALLDWKKQFWNLER